MTDRFEAVHNWAHWRRRLARRHEMRRYTVTPIDLAARLNYPDVWLKETLLSEELCAIQAKRYVDDGCPTKGTEHFRYGAFRYWTSQVLSEERLDVLLTAAAQDPDKPMAGAVLRDIVSHRSSTPAILNRAVEIAARSGEYHITVDELRAAYERAPHSARGI